MQKFLITAWSVRDGSGSAAAAPPAALAAAAPAPAGAGAAALDGSDIGGTIIRSV